jgi:hypothetical protein
VHACNSSTEEDEAGGLLIQGQPGLHKISAFKNKTTRKQSQFFWGEGILCLVFAFVLEIMAGTGRVPQM